MHRAFMISVLIAVPSVLATEALAACGSNPSRTCLGHCGSAGVGLCDCDSECETNGDCCPDFAECCPQCVNPCVGKECGDDGCGGSCGTCGIGPQWSCVAGKCVCTPYCAGAVCGKDGCGGLCGTCPAGQVCAGGKCVTQTCTPNCTARQCGDGGCPDQPDACGVCPAGQTCSMWGQCQGCVPQCGAKDCGDDGCGGSCGTCPAGKVCNASGQCVTGPCVPDCAGKQCGDDGCGGSCGTCVPGQTCDQTGTCVAVVPDPGQEDAGGPADLLQPGDEAHATEEAAGTDLATPDESGPAETVPIGDPGADTSCPPGYRWSYGRCVATPGGNGDGGTSGGCRAGREASLLGLVLVVWLAAVAYRSRSKVS